MTQRFIPEWPSSRGALVAPPKEHRGQRGETLIEMLLTMLIMGTVVLALIGFLLTVVVASIGNRGSVSAGNQATTVAESIDRLPYVACGQSAPNDPKTAYSTGLTSMVQGYEAPVVTVKYLDSSSSNTPSYVDNCPASDQGTQLVIIKVRMVAKPSPTAEVRLVKRNTTCPANGLGGQLEPGQEC